LATKWFTIKTFYRSFAQGRPVKPDRFYDPEATLVEERTQLIKAKNRAEAIKKVEKDANQYAKRVRYTNPYEQEIVMKYSIRNTSSLILEGPFSHQDKV